MSTRRVIFLGGLLAALVVSATSTAAHGANEFREARRLKANPEHGRALFIACAACHQANGAGRAHDGVPNIAGQHYRFLLEQLVDFRESERIDLRMNAAAASHALKGPQELADVAAYVAALDPQPTDDPGPAQFVVVGQNIYVRACSQCHGISAEGDGKLGYPRLASQHFAYLTREIAVMRSADRPNISWDHLKLLESLTPDEVAGVAAYLARLGGVKHARIDATTSISAEHGP